MDLKKLNEQLKSLQEANMSYCRFENTLQDLMDCYENIEDVEDLSYSEKSARKRLIELCKEIGDEADYYLNMEAGEE